MNVIRQPVDHESVGGLAFFFSGFADVVSEEAFLTLLGAELLVDFFA
jgi:hypothetical protein